MFIQIRTEFIEKIDGDREKMSPGLSRDRDRRKVILQFPSYVTKVK